MSTIARKFLILLLAGAGLAAVPQVLGSAPAPAASVVAPAAASCGPPPPPRPRAEEEGCRETPAPALARR